MSENEAPIVADSLSKMLERNEKGVIPETPFELIHHPETDKIITRVASRDWQTTRKAFLGQGPMNVVALHERLKTGKNFQSRESEEAEIALEKLGTQSLKALMRGCLKDLPEDHSLHQLTKNIQGVIAGLINRFLPMTLEEVKLFEERTRNLPGYAEHRNFVAQEGKKPTYSLLKGFDQIPLIVHQNTANTVWINLILSAIEQDDYANIPQLLADAPVGDKLRDVHRVLYLILHDPVLEVSPEMLGALLIQYNNLLNYGVLAADFVKRILGEQKLVAYYGVVGIIAQQNILVIGKPRETSCFMHIFQNGTPEMILGILQTQEMTNWAREHIIEELKTAYLLLTQVDTYLDPEQAELLKSLAQESGWEVTFPE